MERFDLSYAKKLKYDGDFDKLFHYCNTHVDSTEATNILSECYSTGVGVPCDLDKSFEIDKVLIQRGCLDATARIAYSYLFERKHYNPKEGLSMLENAINQGCGRAFRFLAYCYEYGIGVDQNYSYSLSLYEKAIEHGDYRSYAHLGSLYESGTGTDQNIQKAIELYQKAIDHHIGTGYLYLGYCYENGNGVDESAKRAVELFESGKKYGNASSAVRLAQYYENGWDHIKIDKQSAFSLYYDAAIKGAKQALRHLGRCYLFGIGVEADRDIAIDYFDKSISVVNNSMTTKNPDEWYISIAELLDESNEYKLAFKYYQMAAELGSSDGIFNVAYDYQYGYGVEENTDKAIEYYKKANELGNVSATLELGLIYFENRDTFDDGINKTISYLEKVMEEDASNLFEESLIKAIKALITCHKEKQDTEDLSVYYQRLYEIYISKVNETNGDAEYNLGLIFKEKESGYYDLRRAFEYFEQGALKKNIKAVLQLSACYERGRGIEKNQKKAFMTISTFKEDTGIVECYLGLLYQYGIGVKKSPQIAVDIFNNNINSENRFVQHVASICLGLCYYHGDGVGKDEEKSRQLLSENPGIYEMFFGNVFCHAGLAFLYKVYFEPGEGVGYYFKPDPQKYFEFISIGYNETHESRYAHTLGTIFLCGNNEIGIKHNLKKAYMFFNESKSDDNLEEIAIMNYYGLFGKDNNVAIQLATNASMGSSRAELYLGLCYYHGFFVEQNINNAIEHLYSSSNNHDELGWIGLTISSLLKLSNTKDYALHYDSIIEDLRKAAQNHSFVKVLFPDILNDDSIDFNLILKLAPLRIALLELFLKRNYFKYRFSVNVIAFFYYLKLCLQLSANNKKGSDIDYMSLMTVFKEQLDKKDDELRQMNDEIRQKDHIIENQNEILKTLNSIDKKIDKLTDVATSIDNTVKDIQHFITVELIQTIKVSKEELNKRLEQCSDKIENSIESNKTVITQKIDANFESKSEDELVNKTKELLESEHEKLISDFITSMSSYINANIKSSNDTIEKERQHLQNIFGSGWNKLQTSSQTSLISAGVLWESCSTITNENFDFSGVCISATSALESELKKCFFTGFQNYLISKYGAPSATTWTQTFQNWPDQLLSISKQEYENKLQRNTQRGISKVIDINLKTEFTIGSVPYLFGVRSGTTRKSLLIARLNEYLKTIIINNVSNPCDYFIKPNCNMGMSIIDWCEMIRKQYRNPSAHVDVVDRSTAEECYHKVIGKIATYNYTHNVTGLLSEIMNLIK